MSCNPNKSLIFIGFSLSPLVVYKWQQRIQYVYNIKFWNTSGVTTYMWTLSNRLYCMSYDNPNQYTIYININAITMIYSIASDILYSKLTI